MSFIIPLAAVDTLVDASFRTPGTSNNPPERSSAALNTLAAARVVDDTALASPPPPPALTVSPHIIVHFPCERTNARVEHAPTTCSNAWYAAARRPSEALAHASSTASTYAATSFPRLRSTAALSA